MRYSKTMHNNLKERSGSLQGMFYTFVFCLAAAGCSSGNTIKQAISGNDYFEGIITMKSTATMDGVTAEDMAKIGSGSEVKYYLKGENSRLETPSHIMIFNLATQKSCTLNTEKKTYYCFTPKKDAGKPSEKNPTEMIEPTLTATGQTEVVAGYKCKHWMIEMSLAKIDACIAKDLKHRYSAQQLKEYASAAETKWVEKLEEGYPMKTTVEVNSRSFKSKGVHEVVKVEPMKLDDSMFAPSAGYKEVPSPFDKL